MFTDPFAVKPGSSGPSLLGALISFVGAGFGALQGYVNSQSAGLDPLIKMQQFTMFVAILQLIFFPLFIQDDRFYSFDSYYGAFGWLADIETLLMVIAFLSPITGVV